MQEGPDTGQQTSEMEQRQQGSTNNPTMAGKAHKVVYLYSISVRM